MDKQEAKEKIINSSWHWIGRPDKSVSVDLVLDIIDDIDVQEPPAIPPKIAERIKEEREDGQSSSAIYSILLSEERTRLWAAGHKDTLMQALVNGYTIKKNLVWVVKSAQGSGYLIDYELYADSEILNASKNNAYQFDDKQRAEAVATLVGGTVEEWSE